MSGELRDLPCYLLYVGWRRAQRYYAPALGDGVNPQRMYVLDELARNDGVTVKQLGEALEVDPGTISGLLTRMQRDGLLVRRPNPDNGNEVHLRLTPRGRAAHRRAEKKITALDRQLTQRFDARDLQSLSRIVAAFETT